MKVAIVAKGRYWYLWPEIEY